MFQKLSFRKIVWILILCPPMAAMAQQSGGVTPQDIDFPGFTHELIQQPNKPGYLGIIFWTPPAYWEESMKRAGLSADKAREQFAPLRKYTMILVAVGKIGIGTVDWSSEPQIREGVRLRDAAGNTYEPLPQVSGDAAGLASILKPTLSNVLGPMGQGVQILFFPGADKKAQLIADPLAVGNFSVVLRNLMGPGEASFEWTLPLTSLSPPKFCPVGGEKVQANWKYCPWHGNKLSQDTAPPAVNKP